MHLGYGSVANMNGCTLFANNSAHDYGGKNKHDSSVLFICMSGRERILYNSVCWMFLDAASVGGILMQLMASTTRIGVS